MLWRCSCDGVLDIRGTRIFPREQLAKRPWNFWRYRESLGLPDHMDPVSLGEVMTPLTQTRFRDWEITVKLEYMLPTGSYKDRGVAVCMNQLSLSGVSHVAEDSSGNAGASTAAYAAAAGIRADIYVPSHASPAKINQIRVYGAECHLVPGSRTNSSDEAQRPRPGVEYIGHSWNPFFACGIKSIAYEIAEQRAWNPPEWIVVPAGGGGLVMGIIDGFMELLAAEYITRVPNLLVVQSAACAPIYQAWVSNAAIVSGIEARQTRAEGVALPEPVRGTQVLQAIRDYKATMVSVDEVELMSCWRDMARTGLFIELTSAVTVAGAWLARDRRLITEGESVVVVITGHGLKTSPELMAEI